MGFVFFFFGLFEIIFFKLRDCLANDLRVRPLISRVKQSVVVRGRDAPCAASRCRSVVVLVLLGWPYIVTGICRFVLREQALSITTFCAALPTWAFSSSTLIKKRFCFAHTSVKKDIKNVERGSNCFSRACQDSCPVLAVR